MTAPRRAAVLWAWAVAVAAPLTAQEPDGQAKQPSPPSFRRIYFPADEINSRPWKGSYLPIDAKEFQRLLETAEAGAAGAPDVRAPRIESIEYDAELAADDLLAGSATLQLAKQGDAVGSVLLDPCSLAVQEATWKDRPAQNVALGNDADGRLRLVADGSTLALSWSQRGERTASGAVSFALALPPSPRSRLSVIAPAGFELTADRGVITRQTGERPNTVRWIVELGGHHELRLRVTPEGASRDRRPLTLLRQATTYEISARGVNVVTQLRLDIHGEPLRRIAVDLDPALRLVAARYGEQEVPWSTTLLAESRLSRVTLQLPEAISGTSRVLQLSAIVPLTTGQRWRLPAMRPQGMSWQEGTATLLVPSGFVLEQLTTDGCRQSKVTALPAPAAGESIEVQYFRPDADISLLIGQPRDRYLVDSGTLVEVGSTEVTCRMQLQLSLPRGRRRNSQFLLRPGWVVDAVESADAARTLEWEVEEQPSKVSELRIRMASAITPESPARVIVRGHRSAPPPGAFEAGYLEMLQVDAGNTGTRFISARASEGSELRWSRTEELRRFDAGQMSPALLQLFPQPPTGAVFTDDANFVRSLVAIERRKPSFSTNIRIDAAVKKQQLTETYAIQCVPESARVEQVLIHFSQPRDVPLEWSLAGGTTGQFSARKLSPAEQAQRSLPAGGEAWEVNIQLARLGPFEIRAVRSTTLERDTPLALAAVADATAAHGTLVVRALGDTGITIHNRTLQSVPAELLEADRYQTARGAFHYQPAHDNVGAEPPISIAPAPMTQPENGAWAWTSRVDSRFAVDGTRAHFASYHLQTAGRQQVRVSLPLTATLQGIWVDQKRVPDPQVSQSGETLIDLPSGRGFATLGVYYSTPGGLPALSAREEPVFPQLDLPVMSCEWRLWLPAGYALADDDTERFPTPAIVSPTWSQRLFGLLGRDSRASVFNPLSTADWGEVAEETTRVRDCREAGELFAQRLGAIVSEYVNGEELTWGQLLALVELPDFGELFVDGESLAWIGIDPNSRVQLTPAKTHLERGLALLRQAKLAVLSARERILLTSGINVTSYPGQLAGGLGAVVQSVVPGPLDHELRNAAAGNTWSRFENVDAWRAAPRRGLAPWPVRTVSPIDEPAAQGWSCYSFHVAGDSKPLLRVQHVAAIRGLACAIFLAVVGLGLWQRRQRAYLLAGLVTVAFALCCWLPTAYLPLATAAALGGLLCLVLSSMRAPAPIVRASDASRSPRPVRSSFARLGGTALLAAALAHMGATLDAAQQAEPNATPPTLEPPRPAGEVAPKVETPKPAHVYGVYLPVDDEQKPVGDKVYIPEEFYADLHRWDALTSGRLKGWLVDRVVYSGVIARRGEQKRFGVSQLKAVVDLQVFQAGAQARLAFTRQNAQSPIASARLEGRSIPVAWSVAGDELLLPPLAPGKYRLELELQPEGGAEATGIDLPIPAVAAARLELSVPTDAPAIDVIGARGRVELQRDRERLVAQLGPIERLLVRWPAGVGASAEAPNLEVDELVWVKARPGTTVIDAKFKFRVLAGRVNQIRLLCDPRLKLLPSTSAQSPVSAVHTVPGDPQIIDLELARPATDQIVVDLSFLVTGTSGVGVLRLPRLEASGAKATKRWLGLSVDAALQPKVQAGEDSQRIEVPDFVASWGGADSRPQSAYSVPRGESMWGLATQPSEPQISVEQTLDVSFGRKAALLNYSADMAISSGYVFQVGLQGPPGVQVDKVSVLEDDVQRVARWSTDGSGRITVFLSAPVSGRQRVTLRGRLDIAMLGTVPVPSLELLASETKKRRLQVFRQNAVLAEFQEAAGARILDVKDVPAPEGFGAWLRSFEMDDAPASLTVKLEPNVVACSAVAATYLMRDDDRWAAELHFHTHVTEGLLDALQFEIPQQWSEPFRLEPAVPYTIQPIPGESKRQLMVTPSQPIHGNFELKIRGRITPSVGDRLAVPEILPIGAQKLERFVVVPQHLDSQQISWDTLGLARATLPPELAARGATTGSMAIYQVTGDRFQAGLKAVNRTSAVARVLLADHLVAWQPDGYYQAVTRFDLDPGGASHCELELPAQAKLINVTVEGLPGLLSPMIPGRWRLGLGPSRLSQRVEIVLSGTMPTPGRAVHVVAPRLLNLDVGKTIWSVYSPPQFGAGAPTASTSASAADLELRRLASVALIAQVPLEAVGEHRPEEILRWYRQWKQRYSSVREVLNWELIAAGTTSGQSAEALEARKIDQQIGQLDTRYGFAGHDARPTGQADPATSFVLAARSSLRPTYCEHQGAASSLEVEYPGRVVSRNWPRALAGLMLLALGSCAVVWLWRNPLPELAPWLVLSALGLTWWLLLAPSFVGLILLAIAGWAVARSRWSLPWQAAER